VYQTSSSALCNRTTESTEDHMSRLSVRTIITAAAALAAVWVAAGAPISHGA
jgi:hypothetical protein